MPSKMCLTPASWPGSICAAQDDQGVHFVAVLHAARFDCRPDFLAKWLPATQRIDWAYAGMMRRHQTAVRD